MPDLSIVCKNCGIKFIFAEGEQAFFAKKNFTPPVRCPACRARKREARELVEAKGERDVKRR